MFTIKTFEFNDFGVNTYVLSSDNKECIIIDPGCYTSTEKRELDNYILENGLKVVKLLITHCHIDHILGITHVEDKYGVGASIHHKGADMLRASVGYGSVFGFEVDKVIKATDYVVEGDNIWLGDNQLKVVYTPGHADGSVCYICQKEKWVITGDVLFQGSIGRTDLPTGDFNVLMKSIKTKLFNLDDSFTVYPGHGPTTTIGFEKVNNPFID
jgi:glyoxylase-like metal-dependent hydrolase (beta-lactamase superfamily II)